MKNKRRVTSTRKSFNPMGVTTITIEIGGEAVTADFFNTKDAKQYERCVKLAMKSLCNVPRTAADTKELADLLYGRISDFKAELKYRQGKAPKRFAPGWPR